MDTTDDPAVDRAAGALDLLRSAIDELRAERDRLALQNRLLEDRLAAASDGSVNRDRILWNRRPVDGDGGDIDEIVCHGVTVHVEQMDTRCWWVGLYRPDGTSWSGNFVADRWGRMRFSQQEDVWVFALDQAHDDSVWSDHG